LSSVESSLILKPPKKSTKLSYSGVESSPIRQLEVIQENIEERRKYNAINDSRGNLLTQESNKRRGKTHANR